MKLNALKSVAFVAVLALGIAGCNTKVEEGKDYAVLKKGQQVSGQMVGWVAVVPSFPVVKKQGDWSYALLSSNNVVEPPQDGWVAVNPSFFTQLSGVALETPPVGSEERWVMKPEGKSVPKEKAGWIALPYSVPQVEASSNKKGREMASIAAGNLIPKEMHGWAAVDRETLSTLVGKFMLTGAGARTDKK